MKTRHFVLVFMVVLLLSVQARHAACTLSFIAAQQFNVGNAPYSIAIGDLNGDGKPDIAVTNRDDDNVSILLGNGDGTFQAAVNYGAGDAPKCVAIGYLDGDGNPDLAIANENSNNVSILLGNGDGTFQTAVNYGAGGGSKSLTIGNLNNDGNLDLATANNSDDNISVLIGNGDGTFQAAVNYNVGDGPTTVATDDLNGDGNLDIVTSNNSGVDVSVLMGNGNGTFQAAVNYGAGNNPASVAIGYLDGDNNPDIAASNGTDDNVFILLGNGDGTFQAAVNYATGNDPETVAIGDLNGDGKLDIVTANQSDNNISILLGNGDGTFQTAINYATGGAPEWAAIGDLNGDGKPDIVTANQSDNNVSIFLNNTLTQREILIDLYNSTNGDSWTDNSGWKDPPLAPDGFSAAGECDTINPWYGVTCSAGNVTRVTFFNNNLVGTIPVSIGGLTYLTRLDLIGNPLTGTIPSELENLINLQSLYLYSNQLSGPIPPELGNLTNLQVMELNSNQLTGAIPSELGDLISLTRLRLSGNQLSGTIPQELESLVNLWELDLAVNQLSGSIPTGFGNILSLRYFNLYGNQLTGSIPSELGNLINLLQLKLYSNQFSGSIPPELGNIASLEILHLASNQLTGSIPPQLGNLLNLKELSLYATLLSGSIPPELGNLTSLTTFQLHNNQLTGPIPPELGNLTSVGRIWLQQNQLIGSIPPELGNLTSLNWLQLNDNQLSGSIPPALGNLTNLQRLYLYRNQLTDPIPPELGNLASLQRLSLTGNKLTGSIPVELTNLTTLTDGLSDFRWNALYTFDNTLKTFLNSKQSGGDWESTQTVAPTNLAASNPTEDSVTLTWTAIPYTADSGGYGVGYSTIPGGPYTLFENTGDKTVTSSTVTGLMPGTTYFFVLETFTTSHANNQNTVFSEHSTEISAGTLVINSPPNIPTVVGPENESVVSLGDVTLQSSAFSDPDLGDTHALTYWQVKYAGNVYRRQDYPASFNFTATSTDLTAYTVAGLVDGMKYEWRVGYVDSDDNARWSRDYAFKVGVSEAANVPMVYPGTVVNEFKMMTLPYWFDDPRGLKVLGVTTYDRTELRVGGYDCEMTPPGYIEADHPQAFANPGEGFWTLARNGLNITAGGIPVTTEMDLEVPLYYNPDYSNGWNQIGPPNTKNYYFQDLEIIEYDPDTGDVLNGPFQILGLSDPNPYIELKIWRWNNGSYEFFVPEDNFLLEKYEAYWVKTKKSNLYLIFRVSAQQAAVEKKKTIMLADLLRKGKRWFRNGIFVSPQAYAGPGDTPPMPMGGLAETKEGRGCFIATAAFGSPMQRHVKVLRNFRDRYLLSSSIGKKFVQTYYRFSPAVADVISKHDTLKSFVRVSLLPIVLMSWLSLKLGFIFILAVMFLFACGTIYMIRKKYKVFVF